jgi:hypothetical protein
MDGTSGKGLRRLIRAVRRHGVLNALRLLPRNSWEILIYFSPNRRRARRSLSEFDRRFGVDTARNVEVRTLDIPPEIAALAGRYQTIGSIGEYLADIPVAFDDYTFVDYGCGKGKALLMASEFPFEAIVGVECSALLAGIARTNISLYNSITQRCKLIHVIESDASIFQPPAVPTVYFLYNPFARPILHAALVQIQQATAQRTKPNYLVYVNPRHRCCLDASAEWAITVDHGEWLVYQSTMQHTDVPALTGSTTVASDVRSTRF